MPDNIVKQALPPQLPAPATPGVNDIQGMKDIIDIKPPENLGIDPQLIKYSIWIALIAILILILFFGIRYFLSKRKKAKIKKNIISPHDQAALELGKLEKSKELENRLFYFRLSTILRGYTGQRFSINALEMTKEELLPEINRLQVEKELGIEFKRFIKASEEIKFSDTEIMSKNRENDLSFVKKFISLTTPPDINEQDPR